MNSLTNPIIQNNSEISTNNNIDIQIKPSSSKMTDTDSLDFLQKIEDIDSSNSIPNINSKEDMEQLVMDLNKTIEPITTKVKFGVDADDIFFVSVIDTETNRMIRRFPAEKAISFFNEADELTGILVDSKG